MQPDPNPPTPTPPPTMEEDLKKAITDLATLADRYNLLQADFSQHLHDHALMMAVPTDSQRALLENVQYLARQISDITWKVNHPNEPKPPQPPTP